MTDSKRERQEDTSLAKGQVGRKATQYDTELAVAHQQNLAEKAKTILAALVTAIKNETLYPPKHSITLRSIENLFNLLTDMLTTRKKFAFNMLEEELFFDDIFLAEESLIYSEFVVDCKERKVESITFLAGLELREVAVFVQLLNRNPDELDSKGGLIKNLADQEVSHITLGQLRAKSELEKEPTDKETRETAFENYQLALETFRQVAENVREGQLLDAQRVKRTVRPLVDLVLYEKPVILRLSTIKNHDQYTYYHSVNTLILSLALGTELGFKKVPLMVLGSSALLHDIGKIKTPIGILKKPSSLTSEEWSAIKRHPVDGAEVLSAAQDLNKLTMVVAFEHHMGYNCSGYPTISSKRTPHFFSRIVQIADVYDAMTSNRYYRKAALPNRALNTMLGLSGEVLDPLILKVFINMMGIYPVGSLVELDSNEIGVVFQSNPADLLRPKIKLIMEADGKSIEPKVVDLMEKDGEKGVCRRTVVKSLSPQALHIDVAKYI